MSSIGAVIERARAGGQYSERKRFTIARGRAIEKMRRFALADPHYYILELIQAAVANEARYIDIGIEDGDVTLAYVGGGLKRDDLANLFDYLFASKDRLDIGHLRALALGINAALLFNPGRVVIESGDGTLAGTTRLEVHGRDDTVDIGTPDRPLAGTFVRLEGMRRLSLPSVFQRALFGDARSRELQVIETRCLTAPVPIILNGDALFGFSAQRMPAMLGERRVLSFDEGDLYGTLALRAPGKQGEFDLLTWGVLVQSRNHQLLPDASISGIVCFDRLRKTADHSGIVDDERMAEMWARLLPYAQQLVHGEHSRAATMLTQLDGAVVPAVEVRPLVQETRRLVLVPPETPEHAEHRAAARGVSRRLGAPVFCAQGSFAASLRAMSGGALSVVTLDPADDVDTAFFQQEECEPPARPWLAPVIELEPLSTADVLAEVIAAHVSRDRDDDEVVGQARTKAWWLGTGDQVQAAVFTPAETRSDDALFVEVVTTDRLVWSGSLPSAYPGHVLRITLPDARPRVLQSKRLQGAEEALCIAVARAMAVLAAPVLRQAFRRAVEGLSDLDVQPRTPAALLALRAAARVCVPRLGVGDAGLPTVELEQVDARHLDLRTLPVLRTVGGVPQSLADVAARMAQCHGLIYGVLEGMPTALEGLASQDILSLSLEEERWIILLFGESSYVRVDLREVLAESDGARVRDVAVGLRAYPDHPLLVEHGDPVAAEAGLVRALIDRFVGKVPARPPESWPREAWQECRRHAGRVLQRYVCEVLRRDAATSVPEVFDLPLFLDPDGRAHTIHAVVEAMRQPGGLPLVYGHAFGGAELGALANASEADAQSSEPPYTIAASSWLHHCLARLGPVRVAFDFDLAHQDAADAATPEAWLFSREVRVPGFEGVVGVPKASVPHPDIAVLLPEGRRSRALSSVAVEFGCVGWVRLDANAAWDKRTLEALERGVREACTACLQEVYARVVRGAVLEQRARCETLLLSFAARHLSLVAQHEVRPQASTTAELADHVLALPLFPTADGEATTGWRLVRAYCSDFASDPDRARADALSTVRSSAAAHLRTWVATHLHEARVVLKPRPRPDAPASSTEPLEDTARLQALVRHWLSEVGALGWPSYVWVEAEGIDGLCQMDSTSVSLSLQHTRVTDALYGKSPQALAWLLLAVFAHVNARSSETANQTELRFQRAVAAALVDGSLRW